MPLVFRFSVWFSNMALLCDYPFAGIYLFCVVWPAGNGIAGVGPRKIKLHDQLLQIKKKLRADKFRNELEEVRAIVWRSGRIILYLFEPGIEMNASADHKMPKIKTVPLIFDLQCLPISQFSFLSFESKWQIDVHLFSTHTRAQSNHNLFNLIPKCAP